MAHFQPQQALVHSLSEEEQCIAFRPTSTRIETVS